MGEGPREEDAVTRVRLNELRAPLQAWAESRGRTLSWAIRHACSYLLKTAESEPADDEWRALAASLFAGESPTRTLRPFSRPRMLHFTRLIDLLSYPVTVVATSGQVTYANLEALEQFSSRTWSQSLGSFVGEWVDEQTWQEVRARVLNGEPLKGRGITFRMGRARMGVIGSAFQIREAPPEEPPEPAVAERRYPELYSPAVLVFLWSETIPRG